MSDERARVEINVDAGEIGRALTMVAFIGCALKDGDAGQRARLRDEALPMLRDTSNPMQWVVERVFDIMGPEWNPVATGDGWGEWLEKLLAERRARS
jgi:hypothetical protein